MSQAKNFVLIMLYDKMAASLPVAQALKEKNIDVHVVQNAGELIQSIASRNVDMVGLSVNHASSRSLVQVLREKTRVKILVFGEDKSINTSERIDRIDADFKVLGVATAYNIWMKIAQLVKARMKELDSNGNILYGGSNKNESHQSIIIKSSKANEKQRDQNKSEIISFSKKKKEKNLKEKTQAEIYGEASSKDEIKNNKEEVMFFKKDSDVKKEQKNKKKESLFKKPNNKKTEKSDEQKIDDEVSALESMFKEPFKKKQKELESNDNAVKLQEELKSQNKSGVDVMEDSTDMNVNMIFEKNEDSAGFGEVDARSSAESNSGKLLKFDSKMKKKNKIKEASQEESEDINNVIPLKEIILSAASNSYLSKESFAEDFGSVNKMTVVPIDRNDERGFLIFCTSDNQFVPSNGAAMESFKKVLNEKISDEGVFSIGESYNIETQEVEIQKWVLDSSDFHYIFEDPKSQKDVLICFLSKDHIYPDTNKSTELGMLKVELDVIPAKTAVNFNVFLYFAQNKRLIPYLRRGGEFTEEQMQRLSKNGIETIYINESDRNALYAFFISQTIHQDLRPSKKAA